MRQTTLLRSLAFAAAMLTPCGAFAQQVNPAASSAPNPPSLAAAEAAYGQIPLTFEANQGQSDPRVKYLSRGGGYSVFLTSKGMVLALKPSSSTPSTSSNSAASTPSNATARAAVSAQTPVAAASTATHVIQFTLLNAIPNPTVVGENQQPGKVNYFVGNNPNNWRTNIPTYGQIRYQNVYPGIDLVYYGNHRQVEYDFDVAAGADPSQIKFRVTGADSLSISDSGNLVMKVGTGQLEFEAPVIYQEVNGQKTRVAGQYQVNGEEIDFEVAKHDASQPLVIDPVLVYSTYLGGRGNDGAIAIGVDSTGNAYITGNTSSPDFPLSTGGPAVNSKNTDPVYVAKLDVSGSKVLYADYIEGSNRENPSAMVVTSDGTVYVTGQTYSSDFPTVNPYQATLNSGGESLFISELSADGSTLKYSTYLGGSQGQQVNALALGPNGEMVVAGSTSSADYPIANAVQSTFPVAGTNQYTPQPAFVTELSADGSSLVYSTYLSGTTIADSTGCYYCELYAEVVGLATDSAGDVYLTGRTDASDFPTTSGAYETAFPSVSSNYSEPTTGFVTKLTSTGQLSYSTFLSSNGTTYSDTYPYGLALDPGGDAYVTGYTDYGTLPSIAAGVCSSSCSQYFLVKVAADGGSLLFSTMLPSNMNNVSHITLDPTGNIFLLGQQSGGVPSSPTSGPLLQNPIEIPDSTSSSDAYLAELDPNASSVLFATVIGGSEYDYASSMAIDKDGAVYLAGTTQSADFPIIETSYQQTLGGSNDIFVSKVDMNTAAPAVAIAPSLLQYSVLNVGVAAPQKNVILRNMGSSPLEISSIKTSGDFAETDNCSPSVPAGGYCSLTVTFTPTAPGSRFGTILIQDNAVGSPHFINLSGVGSTPLVQLDQGSLTFSSLSVGTTSAAQKVTLTNNGNATLNIGSISANGDFAETNNCPSSLALSASCQIQVTFTPTAGGSRTGALTITDNAPDSPETVTLTGSGYVTTATISPTALQFDNTAVNSTTAAKSITVTNTGSNPMVISSVTTTGDFAVTSNCATVAPRASCVANVTFTPKASGSLTGTLVLDDNANGNPHQVPLTGTGVAPVVGINPGSLTFGTLAAGKNSTQALTITNSGNAALSFSGIQVTGDFSQTNNCSAVPAGVTCTVTVSFTPTTSGPRTGSITFVDAAANSPQTVSLSGTGTAGQLSVSPNSLSFGAQQLGTVSAAQTVTLSNTGTAVLPVSGISAVGSFSETNNCPVSLAVGGSCSVSVAFTPQSAGNASGALTVGGLSSTVPVVLSGTGVAGSLSLAPANLTFGDQAVGTVSAAQTVTLSNTGTAAASISGIAAIGSFSQSNNCPQSLAAGASCTIAVAFAPLAPGNASGAVTIGTSSSSVPVVASGTGSDFSITAATSSQDVASGATATYTVDVAPVGGSFASPVKLSCAGGPAGSSCAVSDTAVTPGSKPVQVTVTVSQQSARLHGLVIPGLPTGGFACAFVFLLFGTKRTRIARRRLLVVVLPLIIGGSFFLSGCGGVATKPTKTAAGTPAGAYQVTVTGVSGNDQHTTTLTLNVQ